MSTAQTGWSFSFFILDWAFVKFFFVFILFLLSSFFSFLSFLGKVWRERMMIGSLGFEGAWFFFDFFFTYSILHGFYGVAFVFLDSSCCPDTTICLVLLFFRFLMGLETTELESGLGLVLCCVLCIRWNTWGRWNVCCLSWW